MKKYIIFIAFIIIVIVSSFMFFNKPKSYEIKYVKDDFEIVENYDLKRKLYSFTLSNKKDEFYFILDKKYTKARKIVDKIDVINKKNNKCVSINVDSNKLPYVCKSENEYIDGYIAGIKGKEETKKVNSYVNVDIFDKKLDYLIWDGFGLVDLHNKKEYHFLKKESYNNNLSYQLDDKIVFADYDAKRTFNKFYIFDNKAKKVEEWKFDYDISIDSYFMGHIGKYIYMFDKKNATQYRLDLNKKKIKITSNKDASIFFDKEETTISNSKIQFKEMLFNYDEVYNYVIENGSLYLKYCYFDKKIKVSSNNVTSIVKTSGNTVFYLADDTLYSYNPYGGEKKLLQNFEWKFSYQNKIIIFD